MKNQGMMLHQCVVKNYKPKCLRWAFLYFFLGVGQAEIKRLGCLHMQKRAVYMTHLLISDLSICSKREMLLNCIVGHLFILESWACFFLVFLLKNCWSLMF